MSYLFSVKQRWMPLLCVRHQAGEINCQQLTQHGWKNIVPHTVPESTPFSYQVGLIPDSACSFRFCKYPLDLVDANALDEAIALDVDQWSPFTDHYQCVSFVERQGDNWQVAVWVWPESVSDHLLNRLPKNIQCTHILPELAWQAACVRGNTASLLLHSDHEDRHHLALLSSLGVPQMIASLASEYEIQRFLRGLGIQIEAVERVWLSCESKKQSWLPENIPQDTIAAAYPRLPLLNRARLEGIQDWTNPMSWRNVMVAMASLVIIWMASDSLQLIQRSSDMNAGLNRAQQSSQTVLMHRQKVDALRGRLQAFSTLRSAQYAPEKLLAELSLKIPDDIWLNSIHMGHKQIDMTGQGKDVARLIVLMESIKDIKHASFLSELRPYLAAGGNLEAFQLRLIIQMQGEN